MIQGISRLTGGACIFGGTDSTPFYQFRAKLAGKAGTGDSQVRLRVTQNAYSLRDTARACSIAGGTLRPIEKGAGVAGLAPAYGHEHKKEKRGKGGVH